MCRVSPLLSGHQEAKNILTKFIPMIDGSSSFGKEMDRAVLGILLLFYCLTIEQRVFQSIQLG
ncbi:MAG: hypothetical protein ACE5KV_03330, partial [Thermoplasmata archaeon]